MENVIKTAILTATELVINPLKEKKMTHVSETVIQMEMASVTRTVILITMEYEIRIVTLMEKVNVI